jgi:formiminotetrahydrofolate cyclodeaminase
MNPSFYVLRRNEERLQQSLMATISVPMKLAVTANSLWPTLKELAAVANIACKSDLQVKLSLISCIELVDDRHVAMTIVIITSNRFLPCYV